MVMHQDGDIQLGDAQVRRKESGEIPIPSHRHAAPSAPWPWINTYDELDRNQLEFRGPPIPRPCDHASCNDCWKEYPKSLFPNWTKDQVKRSKITEAVEKYDKTQPCRIYRVYINPDGIFTDAGVDAVTEENQFEFWARIKIRKGQETRGKNRVRAFFLENLSGPVLQMLGTKYNIEPFFWSSSLNWIPSRFQADPQPNTGDHITVTLRFLKSVEIDNNAPQQPPSAGRKKIINIQAPLRLTPKRDGLVPETSELIPESRDLVLDLLSVHLIRRPTDSVIISYHPKMNHSTTQANYLRDRIRFAGQSVYWQKIFQISPDPTFVLLTFVWHAVYSWDEALQDMYKHICSLEAHVLSSNDINDTEELYNIRAHLLHYSSLIEDLLKTVEFILETKSPAMTSAPTRGQSEEMLRKECHNLMNAIRRLEKERSMQDHRLKNVMNLVFSSVSIQDSRQMQNMTEVAVKDSAAMKQIAYLTMIFLPASFVAGVFGMNITQLENDAYGTLAQYLATAIPLTVTTIWTVVAFQIHHFYPKMGSFQERLLWPITLPRYFLNERRAALEKNQSFV